PGTLPSALSMDTCGGWASARRAVHHSTHSAKSPASAAPLLSPTAPCPARCRSSKASHVSATGPHLPYPVEFAAPPSHSQNSAAARPAPSAPHSSAPPIRPLPHRELGYLPVRLNSFLEPLPFPSAAPAPAPQSLPPSNSGSVQAAPSGKTGNPPRSPPASKCR